MVGKIANNETSGARGTYEGQEKRIEGFGAERSEGRRPLGIPLRRWKDNIKMGLQKVGWGGGA